MTSPASTPVAHGLRRSVLATVNEAGVADAQNFELPSVQTHMYWTGLTRVLFSIRWTMDTLWIPYDYEASRCSPVLCSSRDFCSSCLSPLTLLSCPFVEAGQK